MNWNTINFKDADVQLNRVGGGVEVVIHHEDLDTYISMYERFSDNVTEQLREQNYLDAE